MDRNEKPCERCKPVLRDLKILNRQQEKQLDKNKFKQKELDAKNVVIANLKP